MKNRAFVHASLKRSPELLACEKHQAGRADTVMNEARPLLSVTEDALIPIYLSGFLFLTGFNSPVFIPQHIAMASWHDTIFKILSPWLLFHDALLVYLFHSGHVFFGFLCFLCVHLFCLIILSTCHCGWFLKHAVHCWFLLPCNTLRHSVILIPFQLHLLWLHVGGLKSFLVEVYTLRKVKNITISASKKFSSLLLLVNLSSWLAQEGICV